MPKSLSEKISFLGPVSNEELRKLYSSARALIFPTEEDFGIVPLEAQACGAPVIALGRGGALESVQHGHFFQEQTPEGLAAAIREFEKKTWDRKEISGSVKKFTKEYFKQNFTEITGKLLNANVSR